MLTEGNEVNKGQRGNQDLASWTVHQREREDQAWEGRELRGLGVLVRATDPAFEDWSVFGDALTFAEMLEESKIHLCVPRLLICLELWR